MRKAAWGAVSLGLWSLSFGTPVREVPWLHQLLGIGLLVGYLLVGMDPPEPSRRQRDLMLAGFVCAVASFVLAFLPLPILPTVLARFLAVAVAALPLWLAAGPVRSGFIAAGVLALTTIIDALDQVGGVATSLHAYVSAISCFLVAGLLHRPTLFAGGEKRPPRVVVASNIVTYTPEEKQRLRARLEKRFRDGEIPEHVYLDKLQELES